MGLHREEKLGVGQEASCAPQGPSVTAELSTGSCGFALFPY